MKYYKDSHVAAINKINLGWRNLFSSNLDAALDWGDDSDYLYIFKNGQYAKYSKSSDQLLYSKQVNHYTWPGLSPNIDAAVNIGSITSDEKGVVLFFYQNTVLKYSVSKDVAITEFLPIEMVIPNLPFSKVDAAFKGADGVVYFISDNKYFSIPSNSILHNSSWRSIGPYYIDDNIWPGVKELLR